MADVYKELASKYIEIGSTSTALGYLSKAKKIYETFINEGRAISYNTAQLKQIEELQKTLISKTSKNQNKMLV